MKLTTLLALLLLAFQVWAADDEVIRIQLGGEPSSLDPAHLVDQYGIGIMRNVTQGLFRLDENGKLANGLADSYEVTPDGLTYRIRLKKNARWSDGKPVTIDECIYAIKHVLDPKVASIDADSFMAIQHAREVYYNKASPETLGIKKAGDELVVELARPEPAFLMSLTLPASAPLRKDLIEANKGKWTIRHPVTGDYRIAAQSSEEIRLEPNPQAKRSGQAPIVFKILAEGPESVRLLENGELDILSRVTLSSIDELKEKGLVKTAPSTTVFYLSFNISKSPFEQKSFRRAVASAVDRKSIVDRLKGTFRSTTSYLPRELDGFTSLPVIKDPQAVQAMKKAVATGLKTPVRLAYAKSEVAEILAEEIKDDLVKKIGLEVKLEPVDLLKDLLQRLSKEPPEMYILGKTAAYNDSLSHLTAFSNTPDANYSRFRSPEYEHLIDEIHMNPSSAKRMDLIRRANQILVQNEVVLVPLAQREQAFGISPQIKGFRVNPYQIIQLAKLRKSPASPKATPEPAPVGE